MPIPRDVILGDGLDIVPIDRILVCQLQPRLHPRRAIEAIRGSLLRYGQVKPVVINRQTNGIVSGSGVLQAARELGWTRLSVVYVSMREKESIDYNISDNRTAELSKWDLEMLKLVARSGFSGIGWNAGELSILTTTEWNLPPEDDNGRSPMKKNDNLTIVSSLWG